MNNILTYDHEYTFNSTGRDGVLFPPGMIQEARKYFYSVECREIHDNEKEYYREYFRQYPNKGSYEEFYNKCLVPHVTIRPTSWEYEEEYSIYSPEDLQKWIDDRKQEELTYTV